MTGLRNVRDALLLTTLQELHPDFAVFPTYSIILRESIAASLPHMKLRAINKDNTSLLGRC